MAFHLVSFRSFIACAALLAVALHAQTPLLHFNFDEGFAGGTKIFDRGSGAPAHGTLTGNAYWTFDTPGGRGSALDLSTVAGTASDYGAETVIPKIGSLSCMTVTFWINLQAPPSANDRIISNLKGGKGFEVTFGPNIKSGRDFNLSFGVNAAQYAVSGGNFADADKRWAFIAITYDGTRSDANVEFYSDLMVGKGAPHSMRTSKGGPLLTPSGNVLRIGGTPATTQDRSPPILLDDLRIYDSVLTAEQINAVRLSNSGD